MGRIYRSAKRVFVWLGASSPSQLDGIDHLQTLSQVKGGLPEMPDIFAKKIHMPPTIGINANELLDAWMSAIIIITCQWFQRVWVIQEFFLAKEVIFAIEDKEMSSQAIVIGSD
jgi:hypothetical protein